MTNEITETIENTTENNQDGQDIETNDQIEHDQANDNDSDKKRHNFKDGQVLRFIRVRFPGHAKSYPFMIGRRNYTYGQKVIALSDRGMAIGYINSFPYEVEFNESLLPVRTISRIASEEDKTLKEDGASKEKEYEDLCKDLIKKHDLEMNLTHVELTGHGKKAVFYFTAPARVDFRGLVKDLVSELRMRIELRQISARERSAALGGLGPCGRAFCCSTFLSRYGNVNIKMARTQNLTLIPSKLNGLCGQLKCCIAYEEEVYQEKRTNLPEEGSIIQTENGDIGRVNKLHIIKEQFDMLTESGVIKRYISSQYNPEKVLNDYEFPTHFQNISFETEEVIGLEKKNSYDYQDPYYEDDEDLADEESNEESHSDTESDNGNSGKESPNNSNVATKIEDKQNRQDHKRVNKGHRKQDRNQSRNKNGPRRNDPFKKSSQGNTEDNTKKDERQKQLGPDDSNDGDKPRGNRRGKRRNFKRNKNFKKKED